MGKQIMIDGVDVSGCGYYANDKCINSNILQSNCKNVAVCYYKEYKRKEQECEFSNLRIIQLQETLSQYETDLSTKDCIIETLKAQYKELEEQLEAYKMEAEEGIEINAELKAELEQYKDLAEHNGRVCNERLDKIDELEHDINELKAEQNKIKTICNNHFDKYGIDCLDLPDAIENLLEYYNNDIIDLVKERRQLRTRAYLEMLKRTGEVENFQGYTIKDIDQLKATLQEIKEFAEGVKGYDPLAKQILQKIKECEGDNELTK